jgi:GTP-binding protein
MKVNTTEFIKSSANITQCPLEDFPEYAFIGRSNVGKSSLINAITNNKNLAKTSATPGKTQLINHYLINKTWYLVDLPGYGFAKASKKERLKWEGFIVNYLLNRKSLMCLFVLIDSRLPLQLIDKEFMSWAGEKGVPFVIAFTKTDKLSKNELQKNIGNINKEMKKEWNELPQQFITSSKLKIGNDEILSFIHETNSLFVK